MRIRKVTKYGNSHFIALAKTDLTDFDLQKGSKVDIEDIVKVEEKKE